MEDAARIAEDLQTLERAMESFSRHLVEQSFDRDHIAERLTDFSTVLSALRQRVLSLPNEQLQPEENTENES